MPGPGDEIWSQNPVPTGCSLWRATAKPTRPGEPVFVATKLSHQSLSQRRVKHMNFLYRNKKKPGSRPEGAQAIVEFALVLPILMVMLVGIFEVGRLLFIYTAVTNASREAARFGSALGYDDDGY